MPLAPATSQELEILEVQFWDGRKKLVQERDLFEAFGINQDQFEVFQLVCETQNQTQCSYRTHSAQQSRAGKSVKLSPANSAKLFDLLANLPIAKGETGLAVDYLICRRYRLDKTSSWSHACSISAPVGLIPHTTIPISEIPDELPDKTRK